MIQWIKSLFTYHAYCHGYAEIFTKENMSFLKFSKIKTESGGFYCFYVGDT